MKSTTPNDPLDDLIAAALHNDLSPDERTQFDARLAADPATRAAYQEAQAMHDLLEKTHATAQPDSDFEQRMVSGVRRKLSTEKHRETAWESAVALWTGVRRFFRPRWLYAYGGVCSLVLVLFLGFVIVSGRQVKGVFTTISSQLAMAGSSGTFDSEGTSPSASSPSSTMTGRGLAFSNNGADRLTEITDASKSLKRVDQKWNESDKGLNAITAGKKRQVTTRSGAGTLVLSGSNSYTGGTTISAGQISLGTAVSNGTVSNLAIGNSSAVAASSPSNKPADLKTDLYDVDQDGFSDVSGNKKSDKAKRGFVIAQNEPHALPLIVQNQDGTPKPNASGAASEAADSRKLIRNAQLDLEVKNYQDTLDRIGVMTKKAGGYIDTSASQRGGNGKLQGTVTVKILPQNLDDYLLALRELGTVRNQSVSTDDVTKAYFDTEARLANSRKMETQLQELLKRENGKVSDLLQVERELGRVRGDIEGMQGQLKLYDFQVQYATITMKLAEKDLKQTAAYLLKENDNFSLFATEVEATFQKARQAADDFKAQVLVANLNHNSGSDVSAQLVASVPPEQIEPFLAQVRGLGRVANFTRDTKRVAKDGGDDDLPADQTLTEKDKIMVTIAIRSDDETRKQVAMTVVTKTVEAALDQAKAAVQAQAGAAVLSSSLNKSPEGQSTGQLSVRIPGKQYTALMDSLRTLGRTASLSIQRNDDSGPGANNDDAPVIVSLALTDDDAPLQVTEMSVLGDNVDAQSRQIKDDATKAGVEVKASTFAQQPDGTAYSQMTFRMPLGKYPAFVETLKKLGKVESLSVRRNDRPDEARTDDTAPAEISLQLHNQRGIVAENDGIWTTLRHTFGEGASALFTSVRVIGVLIAFVLPWAVALLIAAWVGRRLYIWKKK